MISSNIKKNIFYHLPFFLIISLPFFLITGPFLSDLAVSLCAIIFIINTIINKNIFFKYYINKFFLFFLFFWIILIISSLFSENIFFSMSSSLPYLRFGIFTLSFWYLIDCENKILQYIFYSFLFSFSILIIDGYLQFFIGKNIFGWEIIGTRVSSFFKDELILGSYLSRLYPIFFALFILKFLNNFKSLTFFIALTFFILIEVLIFLSGERVAFFYLNFATLLIIALSNNFKMLRIASVIISSVLILFISYFKPVYFERVIERTLLQIGLIENKDISFSDKKLNINYDLKKNSLLVFSQEHQDHYKSAWKMFKDNKILGIGTKLFRKNCNNEKYKISFESCTTHPHNTYVQLLAENGLLGFITIFFIFFYLIFSCIKHLYLKIFYKKMLFTDFQISLLATFIISLWPFVPTGNFLNNWLSIVYFFPVGIFLWSVQERSKR